MKMLQTRRQALGTLLALSAAPAFGQATALRPLRTVASFSILADLLRVVGGDAIEAQSLVGPNVDTHGFEPTPATAKRLADADLVFVNGLGYEGWLDRLIKASGYRGTVIVASKGANIRTSGRRPDPHAWQDLGNARKYVANLRDALIQARPDEAPGFMQRAANYDDQLAALERKVRAEFAAIPRDRRRVITSHDAFGYLGAAYDIEFLSPLRGNSSGEPSAAAVARLIEQIRRLNVKAVFMENMTDTRLIERIAREGGAEVGGLLYADSLSPVGGVADTFLKMYAHNAATLIAGMQGRRHV